jgi:hypothetical protein
MGYKKNTISAFVTPFVPCENTLWHRTFNSPKLMWVIHKFANVISKYSRLKKQLTLQVKH